MSDLFCLDKCLCFGRCVDKPGGLAFWGLTMGMV